MSLVLVDKPEGISSHRAVSLLRKALNEKKIGHAGTLDPFASGLLVCGVKKGLKLLQYLSLEPKVYEATVLLGARSTSLDTENAERVKESVAVPEEAGILEALRRLETQKEQVPPAYSALHINGKRAYELARAGKEVEIPSRPLSRAPKIHLKGIRTLTQGEWAGLIAIDLVCEVGSGYYVRSMARDLGTLLGEESLCLRLRRTRLGGFTVEKGVSPEEATMDNIQDITAEDLLIPSEEISEAAYREVSYGRSIRMRANGPEGEELALWYEGRCVGVGTRGQEKKLYPKKVIDTRHQ